jgi:hypothetical protein
MPSIVEANTRVSIAGTATPSRTSRTTRSPSHSLGTVYQRLQAPWPHVATDGTSVRPGKSTRHKQATKRLAPPFWPQLQTNPRGDVRLLRDKLGRLTRLEEDRVT